jgi:hypothetical protein
MLASCVNPDDTEVVYLSEMTEDQLKRLIEKLPQKISEGLSEGLKGVTIGSSLPTPSRGLGWWLGIIVSSLVILGSFATVLRYVIHHEMTDPANATNVSLGSLRDTLNNLRDKDVHGLQKDIDHLNTDLGRIQDWQTKMVFTVPASKGSGLLSPADVKEYATRARERNIPVDVAAIQSVAKPLEQSKDTDSWGATVELVSLRSFANSTLPQPSYNIIQTMRPGASIFPLLYSGPGKWILFEGDGMSLVLDARKDDPPGSGDNVIADAGAGGGPARIYPYFIFRNTHIIYHGAPIVLINVLFDHCTFDISDNPNGRLFAMRILESTYPNFKPIHE